MSEFTDRFDTAASAFDQRVRAVPTPGQWGAPSPCDDWTARDIVGHVVRNYRSLAAEATGGEARSGQAELGPDEDPVEAWTAAHKTIRGLLDDPTAKGVAVNGPAGPTTLEEMAGSLMSMDTHVHTWDLARTVGCDEKLDPELTAFVVATLEPIDDMIRVPGVFGPKIDPPEGADAQTQMLYFLGRRA